MPDVPFEQRVIARIGNLGWNTTESVILDRAREVLTAAGVDPSEYNGLSATRREGSLAELCFNSPQQLQRARLLVKTVNKTYVDDRHVWLDVKKSRAELRPARIVHRVTEAVEEMESSQPSPQKVEKKLNGKTVVVGTEKVGHVRNGSWQWLAFARARYTPEQLEVAKSYAEEE